MTQADVGEIVKQLNTPAEEWMGAKIFDDQRRAAASLIERQATELKEAKHEWDYWNKEAHKARAEIDRLHEELKAKDVALQALNQTYEAADEIERLRLALRWVSSGMIGSYQSMQGFAEYALAGNRINDLGQERDKKEIDYNQEPE